MLMAVGTGEAEAERRCELLREEADACRGVPDFEEADFGDLFGVLL